MTRRAGRRLRRLRDRRRRVLRERRAILAKVLGAYLAFSVPVVALWAWVWSPEMAWFSAGLVLGALPLLTYVFFEDSESLRLEQAAGAEELTSEIVRSLRRDGWKVVDNVDFHGYDVDHVAVGPGGVLAIETKWTNYRWSFTVEGRAEGYAAGALSQSLGGGETIRNLLKGNYRIDVAVQPVVVVWGPGHPEIEGAVKSGRSVVVRGPHLRSYLESLASKESPETVDTVTSALRDFVSKRVVHERTRGRAVTTARR